MDDNNRCLNAFQRILCDSEGQIVKLGSLELRAACKPGDNFMSDIRKVVVYSEDRNQRWDLIMKKQLSNETHRKLLCCDKAFVNEIMAYNYVVPTIERFCLTSYFPKKLYAGRSFIKKDEDWVILEDLSVHGFEMMNKKQGLSCDQTEVVMKFLGEFHAASLILKLKEPNVYDFIKKSYMTEIMFDGSKKNEEMMNKALNTAINVLEGMRDPNLYGDSLKLLRKWGNGMLYRHMISHIKVSQNTEWSVISHGDLWTNNLLFRRFSNTLEVKVVDLQTFRCSSPVIDILHLMYSSVPYGLRNKHLHEFFMEYHEAFMTGLKSHLKPEELREYERTFTLKALEAEYRKRKTFGLGIALWLLPMITLEPNVVPDMNVDNLSSNKLNPDYEKVLLQILDEFHIN